MRQPAICHARRWTLLTMALALLAAALVSCGDDDDDATPSTPGIEFVSASVDRAAPDPAAAAEAASVVNALGVDLYAKVRDTEGNLALSPYSIAVALSMARAGADTVTATEMDAVLHAQAVLDLAAGFGSLDAALAERPAVFPVPEGDALELELSFGNAVWPQVDFPFEDAYLELLARHYGAGVQAVDYAGDTEGARQAINGWVADQTKDRIPELIPAGVLSGLTRLVLTNAVYLKAPWLHPFDSGGTADGPFALLDGSTVQVPLMRVTDGFGHATGPGWEAIGLPYMGEELAMIVAVPDPGTFEQFETDFDADSIAEIAGALEQRQVRLRLPSWEFRTQIGLNQPLKDLGMVTAFSDDADFSGLSPEALAITDVLHEAFIAVDEDGTEAAAATAVVIGETSAPEEPLEVTVDRPFLFWIVDQPTGAVLFLGRVTDPTAS